MSAIDFYLEIGPPSSARPDCDAAAIALAKCEYGATEYGRRRFYHSCWQFWHRLPLQVLLARWMGASAFGTYVYVWTLLLVAADNVHIGLPLTAQRFVPEYRETGAHSLLRGYLSGSCWANLWRRHFGQRCCAGIVYSAHNSMEPRLAGALYLACAALPCYALTYMADSLAARSNWIAVALTAGLCDPPRAVYWLHRCFAHGWVRIRCDAGMAAMAAAGWLVVIAQLLLLFVRLRTIVPGG